MGNKVISTFKKILVITILLVPLMTSASWYDYFVSSPIVVDEYVPSTLIISQGSIVAMNPVTIESSYVKKTHTTNNIKILPVDYDPRTAGQCVGWIKYITGVDFSGNAITWTRYINTYEPTINSIIVMRASKYGHVGVVVDKTSETVIVRSRNYRSLWVVSDDIFNIDDPIILGYIKI